MSEKIDLLHLYKYDITMRNKIASENNKSISSTFIVGIDEVGRGPLAGPVVAGAVILDLENPISGINDSKKLSEKKRKLLYDQIINNAIAWAVGECSPKEIDKLNILNASLEAMNRALNKLKTMWDIALIDGNKLIPNVSDKKQEYVIKGDSKSASIASASILAKVTRDRLMVEYSKEFPVYEFEKHKGYPTALHREKVVENGICNIHRKSFCYKLLAQTKLEL